MTTEPSSSYKSPSIEIPQNYFSTTMGQGYSGQDIFNIYFKQAANDLSGTLDNTENILG